MHSHSSPYRLSNHTTIPNQIMSDYNNRDYDENAARFAGEAVGRAEGSYDRADQAFDRQEQRIGDSFRRDEQAVENAPENMARYAEQGFNNTVQGVENIPSDIGAGLRGAANWIGEKIGGVENEGRRAEPATIRASLTIVRRDSPGTYHYECIIHNPTTAL
ncbi:hypothetical protein D6D05_06510 [Aureobasidium pullulans]|nr:hypothetical protein D6D05_06510 [Aureobasidium pullulans]